jgi:uncharacterized membrane protein YgcG
MISKIVTTYLRSLADRLRTEDIINLHESFAEDATQLIDLADTLDEERQDNLTQLLDKFAAKKAAEYD